MTEQQLAIEMFNFVLPMVEMNINGEYGQNKWKNGYGTEYFAMECFKDLSSEFKVEGSEEALFDEDKDMYDSVYPYYSSLYQQWMDQFY